MRTRNKLLIMLLFLFVFLCTTDIKAQNCKQAFYNAKVQYNNGQFERAQNLLNTCINNLNSNSNQLYKVYKLYITSCTENKDRACADRIRNQLVSLFPKEKEKEVLGILSETRI